MPAATIGLKLYVHRFCMFLLCMAQIHTMHASHSAQDILEKIKKGVVSMEVVSVLVCLID